MSNLNPSTCHIHFLLKTWRLPTKTIVLIAFAVYAYVLTHTHLCYTLIYVTSMLHTIYTICRQHGKVENAVTL